ncbi:winged helix family transcriptional regulator [Hylemonella gracilis]|uniref:Winged helix family transcriptional regulator n=1 Tax=Hylemonella gracilis TaxID=80880 RepID=A0A4P6UKV4_9BURK|nr:winged helix-turn-helix domain-containing protein [Hylemonella gracilis]QBK05832.1 winged helix family transcriptional regulator [Hylemonella gracilis]
MCSALARLPPKERSILALLLRHPAEPVSKEDIIRQAWPRQKMVSDESLVRCISQLRRRVPQAHIEAVYGYGYRLLPTAAPGPQVHGALLQAAQAPADLVEQFMHACSLVQRQTATPLARAIDLLRKLTERQPDYIPARVLRAHAILLAHRLDLNALAQASLEEAWVQIGLAQALAPDSPLLAATQAGLYDLDWRFTEASRLHQMALQDLPYSSHALQPYIWHLLATGRTAHAHPCQHRILAQRPHAAIERVKWARLLAQAGERDAALAAMDAARAAHPGSALVASAWCALQAKFAPRSALIPLARELHDMAELPRYARVNLPYVLARCGRRAEARRALDATPAGRHPSTLHQRMARVPTLIELGELDHAAEEITHAYRDRYSGLPGLLHSPTCAPLRQHPRGREILQKFNQMFQADTPWRT